MHMQGTIRERKMGGGKWEGIPWKNQEVWGSSAGGGLYMKYCTLK